ncbi:MAG: DUF4118 domain-containing protein [Clostridia bacterium]|nr:DUF4118 domain-containing protein [Clostridia bacterium]
MRIKAENFIRALGSFFANVTHMPQSRGAANAVNTIKLVIVMALCTAVSVCLRHFGAHETNIVLVYLLGILLFSYMASSYLFSFFASLFGVLAYNFFFTEPYYTFRAYSPDYPMTFIILFCVGLFTSMLTIRIKRETFLAEEREKRIQALYHIGRLLLGVKSSNNLAEVIAAELASQFSADVMVQFYDNSGVVRVRSVAGNDCFSDDKERLVCREVYFSGSACGRGTKLFKASNAYYLPVIGQSAVIGVIGVALGEDEELSASQTEFLDTIAPQVAVVLERETLFQKQEETQIQIQRERLRSDMLRTISHDLRTPLTGIMGSASTMTDNYESISDDVKKGLLKNIYDDASWLCELVENILSMTRFEEGKLKLNIGQEAAEEIVAQAIGHVKERACGHTILANMPSDNILLEVDGVLITQVLVNLIGNAINYTPEGSEITVSLLRQQNGICFEVCDNGPGVSEDILPHVFERFYTRQENAFGSRRGAGLGLSLCKSIVEAHGGTIAISNVKPHGTSVKFCIPEKGGDLSAAFDTDRG